jgi:DnaA family protein
MYKQLSFTNIIPDAQELPLFYWGDNSLLEHQIDNLLQLTNDEKFIYIWGDSNAGKTHLLQTIASKFANELTSIYLPLTSICTYSPSCLENLEYQNLVLIDGIETIAKNQEWEEGMFHLFNRIRDTKETFLIISGNRPPAQLGLHLPDLTSRLQWGSCFQLKEPSDELKLKILIERAEKKGFDLPILVAQYLLSHYERHLSSLMKILEYLDIGSLQAKRQTMTIPFVKQCIQEMNQAVKNN